MPLTSVQLLACCPLGNKSDFCGQPPQEAITIQSLKAELVFYLKYLQANLRSGNNATNIKQDSLYYTVLKRSRVKRESPRLIQVNKRKKLFGMETIHYSKYCFSDFFFFLVSSPYNLNFWKRVLNSLVLLPDDIYWTPLGLTPNTRWHLIAQYIHNNTKRHHFIFCYLQYLRSTHENLQNNVRTHSKGRRLCVILDVILLKMQQYQIPE